MPCSAARWWWRPAAMPQPWPARIRADLGLAAHRHGDEVRLDETNDGESLPLLERLLDAYRAEITAIAIKQPTLEDVFIHLTGNGNGDAAPEATP